MIDCTDMGDTSGMMETTLSEIGKMIKSMGRESSLAMVETSMKENILKMSVMVKVK